MWFQIEPRCGRAEAPRSPRSPADAGAVSSWATAGGPRSMAESFRSKVRLWLSQV